MRSLAARAQQVEPTAVARRGEKARGTPPPVICPFSLPWGLGAQSFLTRLARDHTFCRSELTVRRLIAIALSALGVPLCVAAAQSDQPLWKMKLDQYIIFQRLTPAGVLIVSTENALLGVDTATGQVAWTRADIPNPLPQLAQPAPTTSFGTAAEPLATPRVSLTTLWGTPYVIVARDSANARTWIELIDAHTGERHWSSVSLPIADVHGYYQLPDSGLLLYGRTGSGASAKMGFIAADVAAGNVRWRSDTWFSEPPVEYDADGLEARRGAIDGSQCPLIDSDTTAILVWSPQGPIKVNVRSG